MRDGRRGDIDGNLVAEKLRLSLLLLGLIELAIANEDIEEHIATGIGTEIRENFAGGSPETKVVVDMPEGLGRYGIEDVAIPYSNIYSFEWYLKNHLGSTMLVFGNVASTNPNEADVG